MSQFSDQPIYRINRWITAVLREKGIIPAESAYLTNLEGEEDFPLPFMMVSQQSPESSTPYYGGQYQSLPFCVWTVEQKKSSDQPWSREGNATYIFYSDDADKLFEIAAFLEDLTGREDWSASDLNYFYRNDPTYPWEFKCISFVSGTGPGPAQDEGGRSAYMCIIEFDAVYEGTGRNSDYGYIGGLGGI